MPRRLTEEAAAARMRAAGAEPLESYPGADEPWSCVCLNCGASVRPRLSSLGGSNGQGPCKPCGRLRANAKAMTDPASAEAEMLAKGLQPLCPFPGSNRPWRCLCLRCGAEVTPRHTGVRHGANGCRYCAAVERGIAQRGRSFSQRGTGPLDEAALVQEMVAAGMRPLSAFPGIKQPWPSRCLHCGTVGSPRLGGIRNGQGGCIPCGQKKVARAATGRRLDGLKAAEEMRAAGLTPLDDYPGTSQPWRSRCEQCGREVTPRLAGVRQGRGCRYCAQYGLDLTGPSMVYVVEHPVWGAVKVGIGACRGYNSRLNQHLRQGWTVHSTWELATGAAARDIEQAVLDPLREQGLVPYLAASVMPNGWTETADATRVTAQALSNLVAQALRTDDHPVDTGPRRRPSAYGLIDPELARAQMREAGFEPIDDYPGRANLAWPSRCLTCGTEGRPRLNAIRNRGSGCIACRNKSVHAAAVAAKADEAVGVMRAAGFEPLEPYIGSSKPWLSRCTHCGHESTPAYSNVRQGSTCKHCRSGRRDHPGARRALTPEDIQQAMAVYEQRHPDGSRVATLAEIATAYGVAAPTLHRYFRLAVGQQRQRLVT